MSGHDSAKAVYYALAANFGIAIAKSIAALMTRSGSMLAEAIHSFADCSNQLLLLFGMKRAQRPPDKNHPLGYGNELYFWSFIVAVLLFSIGGLFSIYEGIHKLQVHEPIQKVWLAIGVLGFSIVLESFSLLGALTEINKIRKGKGFFAWLKHTRSSELIVVLGEDIAAILGLVTAFIFVILSHVLNNPVYDAMGSICIGAILLIVSLFLIIRMRDLLIGKSADPDIQKAILNHIESDPLIEDIFNIITIQIGPYVMLAGKIKIKGKVDIHTACQTINRMESSLKKQLPQIRWSFIEPDIK
ncbi:MAG: cation diffusion facilitator family transporter [Proteobacteria bacterium]|nr:cation diffusion facilitator family transporter [Pseudomonadota bacterium]